MTIFRNCERCPKRHVMVTYPTLEALFRTAEFYPSILEVTFLFVRSVGLAGRVVIEHHDKSIIGWQQFGTQRTAGGVGGYRPFH